MTEAAGGGPRLQQKVAPPDVNALVSVLREASASRSVVQVVGGGTRQGYGSPPPFDIALHMTGFSGIEEWDPDDLTVTVGAGTPVADLEAELSGRSQTAVLPEVPGASTVGGVISAGVSSLRRARLLGTRERMLEVRLVTGDGRVVRGGGRVVKNVSGYDLPRLVVGAFGSLGVITSMCLKLWPKPAAAATVAIGDPETAARVRRPLAVLEHDGATDVFLWGTPEEVFSSAARLGGEMREGLHWPADPDGRYRWSLRLPPASTSEGVSRLPATWSHLAIHGAGEIRAASDAPDGAEDLRGWAEGMGGSLVVVEAPRGGINGMDPWGRPPPGLEIQGRLIAHFDPARVINPGRLPGGL
ncbi:MAG TPA: FAD-binding protein [Acidimicrobiia bacterium]|nr:FAD-binding protein [Acidimicrobiia bacterium]